jgi:hypothetical protein
MCEVAVHVATSYGTCNNFFTEGVGTKSSVEHPTGHSTALSCTLHNRNVGLAFFPVLYPQCLLNLALTTLSPKL